jgi:hypothetical protein
VGDSRRTLDPTAVLRSPVDALCQPGGLLFNVYQPPPGFDMSEGSHDDPFCDDESSPSYNVPSLVDAFVTYVQMQAQAYRGNDILVTMGSGALLVTSSAHSCQSHRARVPPHSDFNYENADTVRWGRWGGVLHWSLSPGPHFVLPPSHVRSWTVVCVSRPDHSLCES